MKLLKPLALVAATTAVATMLAVPSRAAAPNDPLFARQYAPVQAGAPEAWAKSRGAGVTIAVIDSGVDLNHPDLAAKLDVLPGSDFQDNDNYPHDDTASPKQGGGTVEGHGTGVASVAAAITDNGIGLAGFAPDSRIMPIRLVGPEGGTNTAVRVPRAIRFAVDNGAKVINLSLATFKGIDLVGVIETPCFEAYQRGALCVVASGNLGNDRPSGYARSLHALLVTANDAAGKPTDFGQPADTQWGISAPGINLVLARSTHFGNGEYASGGRGTSMAAPHVSGAAALLFADGKDVAEVVEILMRTARPTDTPEISGAGILDLAAAFGVARTQAPFAASSASNVSEEGVLSGIPAEALDDDASQSTASAAVTEGAAGAPETGAIVFTPDPNLPLAQGPVESGSGIAWPIPVAAIAVITGLGATTFWRRHRQVRRIAVT